MKYSIFIFTFFFYTGIFAQPISADSVAILKKEGRSLALQLKISEKQQNIVQDKLKLSELEKSSQAKSVTSDEANKQSEESMNKNSAAADKLVDNASEKKYARRSFLASKQARRDAKKARKASSNATDARSDISALKERIEKEEKELSELKSQLNAESVSNL